jgi:hypothetical protein
MRVSGALVNEISALVKYGPKEMVAPYIIGDIVRSHSS